MLMLWFFELLAIGDWISPSVETTKDVIHYLTDGRPTKEISVNKYNLEAEKRKIERAGYDIISTTTAPFDREAIITVAKRN